MIKNINKERDSIIITSLIFFAVILIINLSLGIKF